MIEGAPTARRFDARQRIARMLDPGSFSEIGGTEPPSREGRRWPGAAVVTGTGTVDGRVVCVFAHDFSVQGGTIGEATGRKIVRLMDHALTTGCPLVGLNESGGARIQEGVAALAWYAEIGRRNVEASGYIPQLSLVFGSCAGGAAYSPALTDFTIIERSAQMFVTGPAITQVATGESVTTEMLGGADVNVAVSGNAHFVAYDDADAIDLARTLLSYLPSNAGSRPPRRPAAFAAHITNVDRALERTLPDTAAAGYDMSEILSRVVDDGTLLEVQSQFGRSVICALARIAGRSLGVVASQPAVAGGALDINASDKAARFVRFCDAFGLPIVTFVDVPGYTPGIEQERAGIIRHGAKLLYAYSALTTAMVTVIVRKAYGGGYVAMGSKHLGVDISLAWPSAEIAVMGDVGATEVLFRRQLAAVPDDADREQLRRALRRSYRTEHCHPYDAARRGYVDAVIAPSETRLAVANALDMLAVKRVSPRSKRHGNMPV